MKERICQVCHGLISADDAKYRTLHGQRRRYFCSFLCAKKYLEKKIDIELSMKEFDDIIDGGYFLEKLS